MLYKIKRPNQSGFTIIETLIVLAIAGLIMLIVFLAVPALQRSARNTQRKNDVSAMASAIANYIDNNGGTLPTQIKEGNGSNIIMFGGPNCSGSATCNTEQAKLGYYTASSTGWSTSAGEIQIVSASTVQGITTPTVANTQQVDIVSGYTCNSSGTGLSSSGGGQRTMALVYWIETGGTPSEQCTEQ